MHDAAYAYVSRFSTSGISVIEVGARNVNFTVRPLFGGCDYWGIDAQHGPCVDEVADGALWQPLAKVDLVVCCEVFEHTPGWRAIVANCAKMLRPGGRAVFTCAGPGRPVHGVGLDDPLAPGHYANVTPDELADAMTAAGLDAEVEFNPEACDTYGTGCVP